MFITSKGKDENLVGKIVQLMKEDSKFKAWKSENNMIMSWLINSMIDDAGENFLLYRTSKEIWETFKETYSNKENISALFEIIFSTTSAKGI